MQRHYFSDKGPYQFSSAHFSCSVTSNSLWPHGLHHTRLPCTSPTLGADSNSYLSSRWCYPTISSSVVPFSCLLSFPASGSFSMSWPFTSSGQSLGASVSASVLPLNLQGWLPLALTGLISLLSAQLFIINLVSIIQLLPSWPVATGTRSQMFYMHIGSTLLATHLAGFDQQEEGFCFCPSLPSIDWNVPINPLH